jgi:hypothetical protein
MLYSFAITPDVFEPWAINDTNREGVIVVELLRGLVENGLLANLHAGQWLTQVRRLQDGDRKSPDVRHKVNTCLSLLHDRNRLVRHPRGSHRDEPDEYQWLFWALERHRSDVANQFHGIVATEEHITLSGMADNALVALPRALDSACWQNRPRSVSFPKTHIELRQRLSPLLRYASVVTLIDPYMTCRKDRFFDTVQQCSALLGKHDESQQPGVIRIHAGDPQQDSNGELRESVAERLAQWEEALKPVAAQNGHSFQVSLWANKPDGKRFHDRYLITDQCGVRVPGGLDFTTDATNANLSGWSLLEHAEVTAILTREFHRTKSPYKYLDTCEVKP